MYWFVYVYALVNLSMFTAVVGQLAMTTSESSLLLPCECQDWIQAVRLEAVHFPAELPHGLSYLAGPANYFIKCIKK